MLKYVIGVVVFALLATGAYYVWNGINAAPQEGTNTPEEPMVPVTATSTYATTTFSFVYPSSFSLNDKYAYEGVPNKPIDGVKVTIPMEMATGTNLSSYDTGVSVEILPRAQTCTGDIYILPNVKATSLTENGVEYSLATTSGAGAGNLYEEYVYALTSSKPCTAIRYFIHSTQVANYPEGTVRAFDRNALMSSFDDIRHSLILK